MPSSRWSEVKGCHTWLQRSLALLCDALLAVALAACSARVEPAPAPPPPVAAVEPTPAVQTFTATAYTTEGKTASGRETRQGLVAADPNVLPLGSRIRISDAGPYSGVYTVADTGRAIKGRDVDIFIANDAEAKKFGRKSVQVEILEYGNGGPRKKGAGGEEQAEGERP